MENRHTIFISYSSKDKATAAALCAHLEKAQLRCWMAPRDIAPGKDYAASIIEAINQSAIMILVFSQHSNDSDHVRNEVERAFNKRIAIIPFRISDTLPSAAMEYFLSLKHWLDAFEKKPEFYFNEVQHICQDLLDGTPDAKVAGGNGYEPKVVAAKSNKPLVYGLGILAVLLVGYFIWDSNSIQTTSRTASDTIDKVPVEEKSAKEVTTAKTEPISQKPDNTTVTPPKTPVAIPPDNAPAEAFGLDNVAFGDAASDDKIRFSKSSGHAYGFFGRINGNPVSGVAKHQGNQQYQISKSNSIKGSFQINENELIASVTLLKNGIDFNPGTITLARE